MHAGRPPLVPQVTGQWGVGFFPRVAPLVLVAFVLAVQCVVMIGTHAREVLWFLLTNACCEFD